MTVEAADEAKERRRMLEAIVYIYINKDKKRERMNKRAASYMRYKA
ncbi:MAG: hypothetical protein JSY10_24920 [Paenibacillus sp.]|nr:hypothetical protein [Paenibacillus sp.]